MSFDDEHNSETVGGGQRLTVTRMVTLGVFSLAAPKATGSTETKFINTLHTITGDIVLEIELTAAAASSIARMANDAIQKHSRNVRVFVAERARG